MSDRGWQEALADNCNGTNGYPPLALVTTLLKDSVLVQMIERRDLEARMPER
jgi:hypothetical protein